MFARWRKSQEEDLRVIPVSAGGELQAGDFDEPSLTSRDLAAHPDDPDPLLDVLTGDTPMDGPTFEHRAAAIGVWASSFTLGVPMGSRQEFLDAIDKFIDDYNEVKGIADEPPIA